MQAYSFEGPAPPLSNSRTWGWFNKWSRVDERRCFLPCKVVFFILSFGTMCRLRVFESGVLVLQLQSHSEQAIIAETQESVCLLQMLLCLCTVNRPSLPRPKKQYICCRCYHAFAIQLRRRRHYIFRLSVCHVRSSGEILLPRYLMNILSSLDETCRQYSLAPTDDLIRYWRLKVKVATGRQGEGCDIEVHLLILFSYKLFLCSHVETLCFTAIFQWTWLTY